MLNKIKDNIEKLQNLIDKGIMPSIDIEADSISIYPNGSELNKFYCSIVVNENLTLGFCENTCHMSRLFKLVRKNNPSIRYSIVLEKLTELNEFLNNLYVEHRSYFISFENLINERVFDVDNIELMNNLKDRHNELVKSEYQASYDDGFKNWVINNADIDENYIEIAKHETKSGHAEILDLII